MSNLPMRIFGNRQWQGNNVSLAPLIRRWPLMPRMAWFGFGLAAMLTATNLLDKPKS